MSRFLYWSICPRYLAFGRGNVCIKTNFLGISHYITKCTPYFSPLNILPYELMARIVNINLGLPYLLIWLEPLKSSRYFNYSFYNVYFVIQDTLINFLRQSSFKLHVLIMRVIDGFICWFSNHLNNHDHSVHPSILIIMIIIICYKTYCILIATITYLMDNFGSNRCVLFKLEKKCMMR